jgi:hypothetical protein
MASSAQVHEPERGSQRWIDYGRALYAELLLDDAAGNFLREGTVPRCATDDDPSHGPAPVPATPARRMPPAPPAEPSPGRSSPRRPPLVLIRGRRR